MQQDMLEFLVAPAREDLKNTCQCSERRQLGVHRGVIYRCHMPMIWHRSIVGFETVVMDNVRLVSLSQEVINPVCHIQRNLHEIRGTPKLQRGLSSEEQPLVWM